MTQIRVEFSLFSLELSCQTRDTEYIEDIFNSWRGLAQNSKLEGPGLGIGENERGTRGTVCLSSREITA